MNVHRILSTCFLLAAGACVGVAFGDNGQNTAAIVGAAQQAAGQVATGNWFMAVLGLGFAGLHVLSLQSAHWNSQQTLAKVVQTVDGLAQSLQTAITGLTASTPTGAAPAAPAAPAAQTAAAKP